MKFDNSFPQRVALARNSLNMTQAELARHVGVVQRQIAAYEGGEARPREKALQNLAAALGTTTEWLSCGDGTGPDIDIAKKTVTVREIPLLNNPDHSLLLMQGGDAAPISGYIPAPARCGDKAFAIRVRGNSMIGSDGISFPEGSIVTVDPDVKPTNGSFVLVLTGDVVRFKKLVTEGQSHVLLSLNRFEFPPEYVENPDILATAVHMQYDLLTSRESHDIADEDHVSTDRTRVLSHDEPLISKELMEKILRILEENTEVLNQVSPGRGKKPT
ncbi:LexA family protein [Leclercia tamurae]|uniref:LexA family protein n=1 Tax=Leclercia tamurae TaxID=2926467 RepID=UPI0036F45ADF